MLNETEHSKQDEKAAFYWLLSFVRPYRVRLAAVLLLSLLSSALVLAQPYITKHLIDDGLLARQFDVILWLCGLMIVVGIIASALGAFNRWHYVDVSARILHALREHVFAHLLCLSPTFYARTKGGDILARLDGDIAEIQRFAVDTLLAFINALLVLIGAVILMLSLSWQLTLIAFFVMPINVLFLRWLRPWVERMTRVVRERASAVTAFFFDSLNAVKSIQAVAAERREEQRLKKLNKEFRQDTLRLQMVNYASGAIPGLLTSVGTALIFIYGGYLIIQGQLTLGTLIAFVAYIARATGPVQTLLGLYVALQRARVSLQRVQALTQVQPAVREPAKPKPMPEESQAVSIKLEHVSFSYDNGQEVLNDISLELPAGKKIGLIGESGVGKSTLIDLLHRYYDPTTGRILLAGIDIRDLSLVQLRRSIAIVAQDTVLFSGSVIDNIRYGAENADSEEVLQVAKLAQVDAFVRQLPHGYETDIGSRGTALSGGQRQRIAIARALLQNPLVLILDEATSAVDQATESQIIEAIDTLFAERTRLIISHRPQTLQNTDLLLELVDGRIVPKVLDSHKGL